MAKFDEKNNVTVAFGIGATLSGTTPAAGNIIDLKDHEAATFCLLTGTVTDAGDANGFSVEIQLSDSSAAASFVAVPNAELAGLESALQVILDTADNVPVGSIGYVGSRRYVRAVVTGTTGTNAVVNGLWVLSRAKLSPPATVAVNIAAT
jgi:hypothetical protein